MRSARQRDIPRNETVFLQGEGACAISIVAEGWVKPYRVAAPGAEAVVAVQSCGARFGEAVAFRHDTYPVSAKAASDCKLIRIEADVILRQIRENPSVAVSLQIWLDKATTDIRALKFTPVPWWRQPGLA